jgi:hypothetical protein
MLGRGVALALLLVPGIANAEVAIETPATDGQWHADALIAADLPLAPGAFTDVSDFGGTLGLRARRGWVDVELDVTAFARDRGGAAELLAYRTRLLGGARYTQAVSTEKSLVVRALGGVELGGFEETASMDFVAEAHRVGFAVLVGVESQVALGWGGLVSLSVALALSVQPFGDDARGEARYVGLELIPGVAIGF